MTADATAFRYEWLLRIWLLVLAAFQVWLARLPGGYSWLCLLAAGVFLYLAINPEAAL